MAKKQKRNKKKWFSSLLFLCLFIGAVVVTYFVWDFYLRDKEPEKPEQQQSSQTQKDDGQKEAEQSSNKEIDKTTTEQYDGNNPNVANELSGVITYSGVNGGNLTIRINIDQYLEDGVCDLNLGRNGAVIYEASTNIIGNASTATCEGFDVPVDELGAGMVEIVINMNSGGKQGVIMGEVEI